MLFLSVKQRSWLLSTEKRTKQSGKSPIIVEIRIINLRSLCSGLCQQWTEQPNEHSTMMWSVLLQPVVLAAVERQGEALE